MSLETPQTLFLDRDGTLIRWVDYLCDPDRVKLCPGVAAALKKAKGAGCLLFLHTNQSGVGRGYFGMEAVEAVNERMFELMGCSRAFFDGICIAPDHPDALSEKSYRKPDPRFEKEMLLAHSLSPSRCYMVGDSVSDVQTGLNAGIRAVLVQSELPRKKTIPAGVLEYQSVAAFVDAVF